MLRKLSSALGILRATQSSWPFLSDHLGLRNDPYVCHIRRGPSFHVRPRTDDRHVIFEIHVDGVYQNGVIPPAGVVVDIGANIGAFSLLAAQKAARVVACEPHPGNFEVLQRNIELNEVSNVEAHRVAIWDRQGSNPLYLPDDERFVGRFSLHPGRGSRTIEVECVRFDDFLERNDISLIDLLKIDCEGAEYEILYGASSRTLSRTQRIVVECTTFPHHPEWSIAALRSYLENQGFLAISSGRILSARRQRPARVR